MCWIGLDKSHLDMFLKDDADKKKSRSKTNFFIIIDLF